MQTQVFNLTQIDISPQSVGAERQVFDLTGPHIELPVNHSNKRSVLIGDGSSTEFTIEHGFEGDVAVASVREATGVRRQVEADIYYPDNTVVISFSNPPAANQYEVCLLG